MSWFEQMNQAINYIEEHLDSEIDLKKMAEIAMQSASNFQRVFSVICDVSVAEYIRRRRLTLAAFELQNTEIKIVDLALKYGYDSPEAFARAFRGMHSMSPSQARKDGVLLKAYPRISFQLSIKGVNEMNYRIEKKEAFQVYGVEDIYNVDDIRNAEGVSIPEVWKQMAMDGSYQKLVDSTSAKWYEEAGMDSSDAAVLAYDSYRNTGDTTFPYLIGCYRTSLSNVEGYKVVEVPKATWAVFTMTHEPGKLDLQPLRNQIYTEWLPTSKYRIAEGGHFEIYGSKENGIEYCELWYQVVAE